MVNTQLVRRQATETEIMHLRHRMLALARVGGSAHELAQAALEFHYYDELRKDPFLDAAPQKL